jgi:hypothetical protein
MNLVAAAVHLQRCIQQGSALGRLLIILPCQPRRFLADGRMAFPQKGFPLGGPSRERIPNSLQLMAPVHKKTSTTTTTTERSGPAFWCKDQRADWLP